MPIIRGSAKDFLPLISDANGRKEISGTNQGKKRAKRSRLAKELLPENQVEAQVIGFMRAQGFLCTKQHSGALSKNGATFTFGKAGTPDWRCERPSFPHARPRRADCETLYLEIKAVGKKPSDKQLERIAELESMGFLATWTDSLEKFWTFFEKRFPGRTI